MYVLIHPNHDNFVDSCLFLETERSNIWSLNIVTPCSFVSVLWIDGTCTVHNTPLTNINFNVFRILRQFSEGLTIVINFNQKKCCVAYRLYTVELYSRVQTDTNIDLVNFLWFYFYLYAIVLSVGFDLKTMEGWRRMLFLECNFFFWWILLKSSNSGVGGASVTLFRLWWITICKLFLKADNQQNLLILLRDEFFDKIH